jgi:hypothetical protein
VFKDVVAEDNLKGLTLERDMLDVEVHIGQWRLQVGSLITLRNIGIDAAQALHQCYLRGNVKQLWTVVKELCLLLQVEPNHSMAL